ncbi:uncharacterized protein LOC116297291 isoform X2 [Actinia tenebrosa]|uniref:Uncharacterized protein LOC116297291 isoform X2 n=1 Tax=Actinia tenebrosa TaxID=6105 RepID=A0A6P8I1H9_ACTTE|nr:uncharacterized protein LOC116297291 isoform X2 [Actinia tenebrosa]
MKLYHTVLLLLVLCFGSSNWASHAYSNPFVTNAEEVDDFKDSAFVDDAEEISAIKQFQTSAARSAFVEDLQTKVEDNDMNSLEHLIAKHNEEKRLQIESLMKRGNILDPGNIGDGETAPTCYSCYGNSLKSCLNSMKEKQCQGAQRCYTVHLISKATGRNTFVKGCINIATCQSDICQTIHNTSKGEFSFCKADCCKGKLCNVENVGTTPRPTEPATPPINGPKCYSCQGADIASCASRMTLKQCLPNYQCADAYLVIKNNGRDLIAKGCIPSGLCGGGLCEKLNNSGRYSQCRSSCCKDDVCNAIPTLPTTKGTTTEQPPTTEETATQAPWNATTEQLANKTTQVPTPRPLPSRPTPKPGGHLCYTCSSETAQECYSNLKVNRCDVGKVCFTGEATQNNGIKMFAKGCMRLEQCATSCKRLSVTTKECKVDCCRGDYCNDFPLTTKRPTSLPDTGCYRILSQVLEVFKKLLETIDTLMKFKEFNLKVAPYYQREINSLMGTINAHAVSVTGDDGPEVRSAATKMRSLRKRAGKVLKKLDKIIARR